MLTRRGRQRDGQRKRVYQFIGDTVHLTENLISSTQAQILLDAVWGRYVPTSMWRPAPPPQLLLRRNIYGGKGNQETVKIHPRCLTDMMVIHEVCHGVTDWAEHSLAWHGPEYMRMFITALVEFMYEDEQTLLRECRQRRIKVASKATLRRLGLRV